MPFYQNSKICLLVFLLFLHILCVPVFADDEVKIEFSFPKLLKVGEQAPIASLQNLELQDTEFPQKGSYNLVFYWSLFCSTCRDEIPAINQAFLDSSYQNVKVFFVTTDTKRMHAGLKNFCKQRSVTLPVLMEVIVDDSFYSADKWGVLETPTSFIVSPDGEILSVKEGSLDVDQFFAELDVILGLTTADIDPEAITTPER